MGLGRIFFAMVDDGDVFDENIHSVEDLQVFDLEISQAEGEFARASLEILNPEEGLLAAARKPRIFISCERTPETPNDIVLMFAGRILALPTEFAGETVRLDYLAQPEDWAATQDTLIQGLKVAPYYNELFIAPEARNEPHEVLSAYSSLLHWNRATGDLTLSDFIEGSTVIDVGSEFFEDSLAPTFGDPPINQIALSIEAQWEQIGIGEVDVAEALRLQFTNTAIATPQINTLTPDSFQEAWKAVKIPTGYTQVEANLYPVANSFGLTNANLRSGLATVDGGDYLTGEGFDTGGNRQCSVPRVWYKGKLTLLAEYRQKRRETMTAIVNCLTQDYSVGADIVEVLDLRIQDPVAAVNGAVLDPSYPTFFLTTDTLDFSTYGQAAVEYGLLRCDARLKKGARTVEISFDGTIDDFLEVSCDHTVHIEDDRLPNTHARGKVISYNLKISDTVQVASITIGCTIGTGDDSVGSMGSIEVGQKDYPTEPLHSLMSSALYYALDTHDVQQPIDVAQMESDNQYLIDSCIVTNGGEDQNDGFIASSTPDIYLQSNKTSAVVDLKSMNPSPELAATVVVAVDDFTLPRHINMGDA